MSLDYGYEDNGAVPCLWGGQGEGIASRVVIRDDLLEPRLLKLGKTFVRVGHERPLRLRPEIEFWLCGQGCEGWICSKRFIQFEDSLPGNPVYRVEYSVDFADANDALWFTMRWVGG